MVTERKAGWLAASILMLWAAVMFVVVGGLCAASSKDPPPKEVKVHVKASGKVLPASPVGPQARADLLEPMQTSDPVLGSPVPPPKHPADLTLKQELEQIKPNWDSWRYVGWVYFLILLVLILVSLLRIKAVDEWLGKHKLKLVKPWLAGVLGVLVSFTVSYCGTDGAWLPSFVFGLLGLPTGLSAVGVHQLLTKSSKE